MLFESSNINAADIQISCRSNSSKFDAQTTTTQLAFSSSIELDLAESANSDTTEFNIHCDSESALHEAASTNFSHFWPHGSEIWDDEPKEQRKALKRALLSESLTQSSSGTTTGSFHGKTCIIGNTESNELKNDYDNHFLTQKKQMSACSMEKCPLCTRISIKFI
ncbi:unnamed protein product [Didymodactylos carnosus]|uniref:Uncharacterized protein n=1 Tax=Didymodactylos carnosus TaxID=1234261 RepID=A0A814GU10_9BILA|nr:unnamed protein product [Didymodactylos carnosus]CAF3772567.1 unnamed protein product [Didymodactylos carnosus]